MLEIEGTYYAKKIIQVKRDTRSQGELRSGEIQQSEKKGVETCKNFEIHSGLNIKNF